MSPHPELHSEIPQLFCDSVVYRLYILHWNSPVCYYYYSKSVFQISLGFCALCRRWHIDPLPHPPPPRGCKRPHVTAYSAKLAWPIQFRFPQPCGIVCCIIHFTLLNFRSIMPVRVHFGRGSMCHLLHKAQNPRLIWNTG